MVIWAEFQRNVNIGTDKYFLNFYVLNSSLKMCGSTWVYFYTKCARFMMNMFNKKEKKEAKVKHVSDDVCTFSALMKDHCCCSCNGFE